ncbi:ESPR-type extended signal peptide-containing protein [Dialister succinatiphilus]|uniref:ESPR-type extended signal peptide-containing protein n=1 Tax=Dialister succinatiphilus TaxID=487173 RepID=UPI003F802F6B
MNKIYKVIWSKAKHTYVVASEIAKGHTKGETTGRGLKKLAAALLVAAALMGPNFAWAADTATVNDTGSKPQTVYTKDGADNTFVKKGSNNGNSLTIGASESEKYSTHQYVSGAQTTYDGLNGQVVTQATGGKSSISLKVGNEDNLNYNFKNYSEVTTTKDGGTTFTYHYEGGAQTIDDKTTIKGNTVTTGRVTASNGVVDGTTTEGVSVKTTNTVGQNLSALDDRITAVKDYVLNETGNNYVSKTDAAVQDGAIVKADKTIGENVTNLDAALAKETADRLGADKAQDKVIEQVNQNMVDGFNTINKNMADGFTALNNADLKEAQERAAADTVLDDKITAETSARVAADTKLVEAVNSGVSLSNDNVLQKNTTTIDAQGDVTTSKTDANEMILNKGKDNQITLNEKGIKVGTNSSVMDKDGVYTGGDTYSEAKAALKSDGQIKGANGKFTVDASGNTTVTSLDAGTGTIQTKGDIYAKDATFSGDITAKDATLSGDLSAKDGTFSGDLSAKDGTFSGDVSAKDVTATGTLQGAEVTDGTATMKNGNITGVKNLSAETITTSGDATIGGDLTVKGKLNVDEIDLTKNGIVGDNNVTASTKVAAGEIISSKTATSTKDGSKKESAINYNENGTSTWAQATDADNNWKKSTLTVEGNDVTSKVIDSDKNSNISTQTASESNSTITGTADGKNYKSYITQNLKNILQKIEDGNGHVLTSTEQTETGITNTAANGTITNDAKALVNKASDSITSQIGDGSAVKSVMDANGIANTATGGTISNSAANISNTTTGNMTNTVGGNLIDTIMGTSTTTVTGKVTEDYKSDLSTKVGGDETHAVTGNQTTTVSGNRTVNVKGTETENFNAQVTNVKTDQKTSVGGNQTNIVGGDQQNTVSGSKTETVKGSVTEKYGSQATTVNGDQSTNIGGNQTTVVAKDQTNTVSGKKTETVKGAVNETYGSQTTKVNGDQSTTVTGKQTNSITGDQVNTIGGNQTTAVTGDSSLSAKNITNTASETLSNSAKNITNTAAEKLSNSAAEIENSASKSITDKVGDNVSRTMTTSQIKESVVDGANSNTSTKTGSKDMNIVTDGTSTSTLSQLAGSVNTSLKEVKEVDGERKTTKSLSNVKTVSEDTTKITDTATGDFSSRSQKANGFTSQVKNNSGGSNTVTDTATTSEQKLVSGNIIDILKDAENGYVNTTVSNSDGSSSTGVKQTYTDITSTAKQGTITNDAKNLVNKAEEKLSNSAAEIENTATNSIKDTVGKSTVTTTTDGTTFENRDHNGAIGDYSITKTTISGNTLETGKATMDYAEVMKDLRVGGTTTTKDLHVTNNATIDGTLGVTGAAKFQDTVTVAKDLSVGGNATVAGDVTADSYKVGDKTYIDGNGINANDQVIRNVGKGDISEGSTDAVSGGQLYETNTRVSGLETRMGTVETRVDKLDNKIDKVGANAAAMANLHPLEFDEDSKWNVAAAVGSSGSETASAVGVFYRPNENVMVNASAAMGTGENMFGGGVSLRLGQGGNKAKEAQMKAAAAENKELRAKVDDLTARMDALLSVLNPNMSKDFPDVPENHWAYEAVSRLAGNGIVEGYEDGKYHGERQMTRYEMAEIIYNALSKGAKAEKKLAEEFRPELQAMAAQKKA